jgi:hypothetical protein
MAQVAQKHGVVAKRKPRGVGSLGLVSGLALLLVLGHAAGHSHADRLADATHCALCQVQGTLLDQGAVLPTLSASPLRLQNPTPFVPASAPPAPSPTPALPRGPPVLL